MVQQIILTFPLSWTFLLRTVSLRSVFHVQHSDFKNMYNIQTCNKQPFVGRELLYECHLCRTVPLLTINLNAFWNSWDLTLHGLLWRLVLLEICDRITRQPSGDDGCIVVDLVEVSKLMDRFLINSHFSPITCNTNHKGGMKILSWISF